MTILEEIAKAFDIGTIKDWSQLKGGIVNTTYKVTTEKGVFIIQRLSHIFDERVVDDYMAVKDFLHQKGYYIPTLIKTTDGRNVFRKNEGIWKVFKFIDNDAVTEATPELVYEAGKTLGEFHLLLHDFDYEPQFAIPDFHQTKRIIAKLHAVYENGDPQKKKASRGLHDFITSEVEKHYLPKDLPVTLIHGDPKLENFLFKDGKVAALIDFDTIMKASPLIDMGDALRSWCEVNKIHFSKENFDAAIEGYLGTYGDGLDQTLMKQAFYLINMELAARFLIDVFEEEYFAWNDDLYSSLAEENLDRTKRQITYYMNAREALEK